MKKILLLLCILLSQFNHLSALSLGDGLWTDFEGVLNGKKIKLSLFRNGTDSVIGNYCNGDNETRVYIHGTYKNDVLFLVEGNVLGFKAIIKGKLYASKNNEVIKGFRIDRKIGKAEQFELRIVSMVGGNIEKRYSDAANNDEAIEAYMQKVKSAFLLSDSKWLAKQMIYPCHVSIGNGKTKDLKNEQEFIQYFPQINNDNFKKALKETCTCNLFHNYQGIMLGSGEIWIENGPEPERFVVIGLNN